MLILHTIVRFIHTMVQDIRWKSIRGMQFCTELDVPTILAVPIWHITPLIMQAPTNEQLTFCYSPVSTIAAAVSKVTDGSFFPSASPAKTKQAPAVIARYVSHSVAHNKVCPW